MKISNINAKWYGLIDIDQGHYLQEEVLSLQDTMGVHIIGCEHFEVLSLGKSAWLDFDSSWNSAFQQVHQTNRGGKITLHNPGQLIIYPCLYLKTFNLSIKNYVQLLLRVTQKCLVDLGLNVELGSNDNIGIFFEEKKIGSIGLKCQRGWVSHGLAINVDNDLAKFGMFAICGQKNGKVTSLKNEGLAILATDFFETWVKNFSKELEACEANYQVSAMLSECKPINIKTS